MCRSVPQMPAEFTSMTTCPAPAWGSGISRDFDITFSASNLPNSQHKRSLLGLRFTQGAERSTPGDFRPLVSRNATQPADEDSEEGRVANTLRGRHIPHGQFDSRNIESGFYSSVMIDASHFLRVQCAFEFIRRYDNAW